MAKFRKKPVIIDAVQITNATFDTAHPNPEHLTSTDDRRITYDPVERCVFIKTLEGVMRGDLGDWLITGVKGEVYPCKPDIFAATYEPVE